MNIAKKIEDIRQQPEHVRMRWVWGCVAISMIVILIVWIFSIAAMLRDNNPDQELNSALPADIKEQLQKAPSLKNLSQPLPAGNEATGQQNSPNPYYEGIDSDAPQSGTYSNLQSNSASSQ